MGRCVAPKAQNITNGKGVMVAVIDGKIDSSNHGAKVINISAGSTSQPQSPWP